jgi:hypothetical protein
MTVSGAFSPAVVTTVFRPITAVVAPSLRRSPPPKAFPSSSFGVPFEHVEDLVGTFAHGPDNGRLPFIVGGQLLEGWGSRGRFDVIPAFRLRHHDANAAAAAGGGDGVYVLARLIMVVVVVVVVVAMLGIVRR